MPAPRTLTVTLPIPSGQLGPNGRAHWGEKNKLFQQYKHWAYIEMLVELEKADMERPRWTGEVLADVHWYVTNPIHEPDEDNAISRLKAAWDAGQGVLYENDKQVKIGCFWTGVGKPARVEVTFTAAEEEATP